MLALHLGAVLSWLVNLIIGLFVYSRNPKRATNILFGLLSLSIGFWSVGSFLANGIKDEFIALAILRACYFAGVLLPSFFLHFIFIITGQSQSKKPILFGSYFLSVCFLPFLYSELFIPGFYHLHRFDFLLSRPGPVYYVFIGFFVIAAYLGFSTLTRAVSVAKGRLKTQLTYILIAYVIALTGGINYFLTVLKVIPYPPLDDYILVLSFLINAYAIVRHRLMDIKVVIKKTFIFAGLFSFVFGAFAGSSLLVTDILQESIARSLRWPLLVFVGILVASLLRPLENLLIRVTDRFLFQKKEDFQKILNRLSQRIITILNLNEVAKTVLETFRESLRAETGAVLIKNEENYRLLNSFGLGWTQATQTYGLEDPLIQYFQAHHGLIHRDSEEISGKLPVPVLTRLEAMQAILAIPLVLQGELIGLLMLGKKRSDQEYSQEEMDYFPIVASQVAIALSNARLYGEAVEAKKKIEAMQVELIHREKMAFVADLVKGIAHEVFNPLLPIYHAIGDLERDVLVGLFDIFKRLEDRLDPETHQEYLKLLRDLRSSTRTLKVNSEHIHLVIDTLDKLRKEDKETIGPLDFKMFLKDSRALIGMELHSEEREIPVIEDIQPRLPPVKGNPTLLAQVFVNLFKNAIDAMEGIPEKKITVKADVDPERAKFLKIAFSDTGSGVPADILPKIFDFGFTTKGTQGRGIGLNQCKLIIEKFGGSIQCTSQVGAGTTFTLRLLLWQEGSHETSDRR